MIAVLEQPCLGPWFGTNWIALSRTRSLTILGDYQRAAESFRIAITQLPSSYPAVADFRIAMRDTISHQA